MIKVKKKNTEEITIENRLVVIFREKRLGSQGQMRGVLKCCQHSSSLSRYLLHNNLFICTF